MLALEGDPVSLNACKTMHLMHAWLLYVKIAGFSGFLSGLLKQNLIGEFEHAVALLNKSNFC